MINMMKTITSITIDSVFNKEKGKEKIAKLQALTKGNFHNYEYALCPVGGSFDLIVTSDWYGGNKEDNEKEMMQDFLYILANQI